MPLFRPSLRLSFFGNLDMLISAILMLPLSCCYCHLRMSLSIGLLALDADIILAISWAGKTLSDGLLPCFTGMGRAGTGRALHPAQEVTLHRMIMAQLPVQGMTQLAMEPAELPLAAQGTAVR